MLMEFQRPGGPGSADAAPPGVRSIRYHLEPAQRFQSGRIRKLPVELVEPFQWRTAAAPPLRRFRENAGTSTTASATDSKKKQISNKMVLGISGSG